MSLNIRVVLPPNLKNSYLQNEIINDGETYFTGKASLNPDLDNNRVSLTFGLQLADTDLREPVDLKTINWIKLSNDPDFAVSSTIQIYDFPYATNDANPANVVTGSNKNFIFNINPAAFFDPDNVPLELSRSEEAGDDLFIINNWPLSANGGLSTVYYQIQVQSISGEQGTYPNSQGIYDQVFWQPESGTRPGQPDAITRITGYSGRKSLWRFNAANEAATGLYGTGVARYTADIIELRGTDPGDETFNIKSNITTLANIKRTLAPDYNTYTATTLTRYNYTPSSGAYTSDGTVAINTVASGSLASNTGKAFYSTSTIAPGTYSPDLFAQSKVSISANDNQSYSFAVSLRIHTTGHTQAINSGTSDELEIRIEFANGNLGTYPRAKLYRRYNNVIGIISGPAYQIQTTALPKSIVNHLKQGAIIELYSSDFVRPGDIITSNVFDERRVVRAYLTPESDKTKSYLLGSAVLATRGYAGNIGANVIVEAISGTVSYSVDEIAFGSGRILLDVDSGDCNNDDIQFDSLPTTNTSVLGWQTAITNGVWEEIEENNTETSDVDVSDGYHFLTAVPASGRAIAEVFAYMPTFSDRCLINFDFLPVHGEFYVCVSPNPVLTPAPGPFDPYNDRPMGVRCDGLNSDTDELINKPTLMVAFDRESSYITITQRKIDNTLTNKIYLPYSYDDADINGESWKIIISDESPDGIGDGTRIIIKRGTDLVGTSRLEMPLPSSRMGMGWYVSFGVRSQVDYEFRLGHSSASINVLEPTAKYGEAYLRNVQIYGLPKKVNSSELDLVNQRHLVKASAGAAYLKPLLGQQMLAGNTEFRDFVYESWNTVGYSYFIHKFTPTTRVYDLAVYPQLIELMVTNSNTDLIEDTLPIFPSIQIYTDDAGVIDTPIFADWITPHTESLYDSGQELPPYASPGFKIPNNNLLQFVLGNETAESLSTGNNYWIVVKLPYGLNLARAKYSNSFSAYVYKDASNTLLENVTNGVETSAWRAVPSLWFKLFHAYRERHDNVWDTALIHTRVCAESHALVSSEPSGLSDGVTVDLSAPQYLTTGKPKINLQLKPGVRTTMLGIEAEDSQSGILAFRVGRESDFGRVIYSDWQQWSAFEIGGAVSYTIYHYGSWYQDFYGVADEFTTDVDSSQNLGTDGPRKVWVQVVDKVGNISESYPVTVNAQLLAIVDTTSPTAGIEIVDNAGLSIDFTNTSTVNLKITSSDLITSVKDMRFRLINGEGTSGWSNFQQFSDVFTRSIVGTGSTSQFSGVKRIEIQVRDYGNNMSQPTGAWDNILPATYTVGAETFPRNVLINNAITWTAPGDTEEKVFMTAIKTESYSDVSLVDSRDSSFPSSTAYYGTSNDTATYLARINFSNTDNITLTVNSTTWYQVANSTVAGSNRFYVDSSKGYIVFIDPLPASPVFVCSVERTIAQVWRWDRNSVEKIGDVDITNERVILSIVSTDNEILLGGGSGNLWSFDGVNIVGPIFTASNDAGTELPISCLIKHQFQHESKEYIYVGTSIESFLFRAPVDGLEDSWASIATSGSPDTLHGLSYDISSATSAYDYIFFGTRQGKIFKYGRRLNKTNLTTETESMNAHVLKTSDVNEFEPILLPVNDMISVSNQVLVAIADRPEIYSYSEHLREIPSNNGEFVSSFAHNDAWSTQNFDIQYVQDHSPWQFYNNGRTDTRGQSVVSATAIEDPNSEFGFKYGMNIVGSSAQNQNFTSETGSDWEQAIVNETVYTVEFEMKHVSGLGSQGFEINDGRYYLDIQLTSSAIKVTSGSKSTTKNLVDLSDIVTPFELVSQTYPDKGIQKLWNFSTDSLEDSNSLNPGSGTGASAVTIQGWTNIQFCGLTTGSESETIGTTTQVSNHLVIDPTNTGSPLIGAKNLTSIMVDTHSLVLIKIRVDPALTYFAPNAKMLFTWSNSPDVTEFTDYEWFEQPLTYSSEFKTYILKPSWKGEIRSVYLKFEDIPDSSSRPNIYIDYIAIVTESGNHQITRDFTPVRVGVDGTSIKVWVGKYENPIIFEDNFLSLASSTYQLRFGKTVQNEAASTWSYSRLRYYVGAIVPPVARDIKDFYVSYRFNSTGGVRKFAEHQGSVWALTDGYYTKRLADNPDDHAFKAWSYYPQQQVWKYEDPQTSRFTGGSGIVRPLAVTSFKENLIVAGQRGIINNQKTVPS